ncbi:MAG TPA: hypothetical protein VK808_08880 [Bacteroidia bacterium]|nr:hypothetical protein [Bacteroidia bacterium]
MNKEKKIVLLSFWPFTIQVVASGLLALSGILGGNIFVALFFIVTTLFLSYPLYDPRVKISWTGSKKQWDYIKHDIEHNIKMLGELKEEPGIFSYTATGFLITVEGKEELHNWNDIISMIAYKRDDFTTDCVCLDVLCENNRNIKINEDTKGWYMFTRKTLEQFPQINKLWTLEITTPAFKTNLTLLYDREGRTLEEIMKINYPENAKDISTT